MVETIIGIALIVMAIFLVIAVLMQSSKDHRMGASIAGGAETFFGKQKGKTLDALFNKLTTIIAIIFVLLVIVLYVIQPDVDYNALMNESINNAQQSEVVEGEANDEAEVNDEAKAPADEANVEAEAEADTNGEEAAE